MFRYCGQCGARVRPSRYCGRCGAALDEARRRPPAGGSSTSETNRFADNLVGTIAYCTPVAALALLLFEPFRYNPFVRFHSYQCLFLTLAHIVVGLPTALLSFVGFPYVLVFAIAWQAAVLGMWIFAGFQAWKGIEFRLPAIGDLAARHAFEQATGDSA